MTVQLLPDDLEDRLAVANRRECLAALPRLSAAIGIIAGRLAQAEGDEEPEYISLKEAGRIAGGRSWDSMRRWAEKYDLGHAIENGEWVIDRKRLLAFLNTPKGKRLMGSKRGRKSGS